MQNQDQQRIWDGKVLYFNSKYGFIKYDGGNIFFHKSQVRETQEIRVTDLVNFHIVESKKKPGQVEAAEIVLAGKQYVSLDMLKGLTVLPNRAEDGVTPHSSYQAARFVMARQIHHGAESASVEESRKVKEVATSIEQKPVDLPFVNIRSESEAYISAKSLIRDIWINKVEFDDLKLRRMFEALDTWEFLRLGLFINEPLSKKWERRSHKGETYLEIYHSHPQYIEFINSKYGSRSIFRFEGALLTGESIEARHQLAKAHIDFFIANAEKFTETLSAALCSEGENYGSKLGICQQYIAEFKLIASYSEKVVELISQVDDYFIKNAPAQVLLKLWLWGIIDHFDYNSYSYYRYTLSRSEKLKFTKKVRTTLKAELKETMVKQLKPIKIQQFDNQSDIATFEATLQSFWFMDGYFKLCRHEEGLFTERLKWPFSEERFNHLFDYVGSKRFSVITGTLKGNEIVSIEGLEELEQDIWKVEILHEFESNAEGNAEKSSMSSATIPINILNRNRCLVYLNKLQMPKYSPIRIVERVHNLSSGSLNVDISVLYSIPTHDNQIAIVWESLVLDKSKATHLFKCSFSAYDNVFADITTTLSELQRIRSALNGAADDSLQLQKNLHHWCRVDHDNYDFEKWQTKMNSILGVGDVI